MPFLMAFTNYVISHFIIYISHLHPALPLGGVGVGWGCHTVEFEGRSAKNISLPIVITYIFYASRRNIGSSTIKKEFGR
jgi:hypothetical protein